MVAKNLEEVLSRDETEIWTKIRVKDAMSGRPVTGLIGITVSEIASKMVAEKVGSVIILKEGKPVGIVTDGDLIAKVLAKDKRPQSVLAEEILSKPLRTIDYDDDITEAARRMRRHGMKRLGVMRRGELAGVISVSDIASVAPDLLDLLSEKIRISASESVPAYRLYSGQCDRCETWSEELEEIDRGFLCVACRADI